MTGTLDRALARHARLLLVRQVEERIRVEYPRDEIKTPVHLSIGAEAISVGVCDAAPAGTAYFGTYRNHALFLAATGDADSLFGELYGRTTGVAQGKAGSMHLSAPAHGLMATSAVVGTSIPVAVGAALAHRHRGLAAPVVAFFGDGAVEAGVFWESLNFACLKALPIVFVCEDNGLAIHAHAKDRQGFSSITNAVSAYRCQVYDAPGVNVHDVSALAAAAFAHVVDAQQPVFLRLRWHRALQHVGIDEDYAEGYRAEPSAAERDASDPVRVSRRVLLESGATDDQIERLSASVGPLVDAAVAQARAAAVPPDADLWKDVLA